MFCNALTVDPVWAVTLCNTMDAQGVDEEELRQHLDEQRAALEQVQQALAAEPSEELEEVRQQLQDAIVEMEGALLSVKKERLLAMLEQQQERPADSAAAAAPGEASTSSALQGHIAVGSACRFRFDDGCWYLGQVVALIGTGQAQVAFATPTRKFMLEGAVLPLGRLRSVRAAGGWGEGLIPNSTAYARPQAISTAAGRLPASSPAGNGGYGAGRGLSSGGGLWVQVVVRSKDEIEGTAVVALQDGTAATLALEDLIDDARLYDSDLDYSDDEAEGDDLQGAGSGCSDMDEEEAEEELQEEEQEVHGGLGLDVFAHARLAAKAGRQTDVTHFADWEQHSRGIGSKLMARMGYIKGQGLGRAGTGEALPLEVQLLPQRQGLGAGKPRATVGADGTAKRTKKRGGERSRRRKHAEEARKSKEDRRDEEAKAEREQGPGAVGLFSFINQQLGDQSAAAAKLKAVEVAMLKNMGPQAGQGRFDSAAAGSDKAKARKDDRSGLMVQADKVAAAQARVDHFRAMLQRNNSNKELAAQIRATLTQAQGQVQTAQSELARMQRSVKGGENAAKFLKF